MGKDDIYPLEYVPLDQIRANPLNPRKNYSGPAFDDLVASIEQKGVIQPIIVRRKKSADTGTEFELVAGHRRHKAAVAAAGKNGGTAGAVIPAIVRDLTDEEAFEFLTIENLQREDLTELEEAEAYQTYLAKRGDDALEDLALKVGVHPGYIRRRIGVMGLPKYLLKAWDGGEISFGHLEQFLRIKNDLKLIKELFGDIQDHWNIQTVADLKEAIDNQSPLLTRAKFDVSACGACCKNTDAQKRLFNLDSDKTMCLDPKCFKKKALGYLEDGVGAAAVKRNKTQYWNMIDAPDQKRSVEQYDCRQFNGHYKVKGKCKGCNHFHTVFDMYGAIYAAKACVGNSNCFYSSSAPDHNTGNTSGDSAPAKRPTWHGTYFRDDFYQKALPLRFDQYAANDEKILRMVLFSVIESNNSALADWFMNFGGEEEYRFVHTDEVYKKIETMTAPACLEILKQAALKLAGSEGEEFRELMAVHLGADIEKEFSVTEEYLSKKTKAEIIDFMEGHKLMDAVEVQTYLYEKLLKKRGKISSCKKSELIRLVLESGVDLVGKVPDEILKEEAR